MAVQLASLINLDKKYELKVDLFNPRQIKSQYVRSLNDLHTTMVVTTAVFINLIKP